MHFQNIETSRTKAESQGRRREVAIENTDRKPDSKYWKHTAEGVEPHVTKAASHWHRCKVASDI